MDQHYLDLAIAIDQGPREVSLKEADFLQYLLKEQPYRLTKKQMQWLEDMGEKYLSQGEEITEDALWL